MTKRWGSKNFGAFLDALHGDAAEQQALNQRMLGALGVKSPCTLEQLARELSATELQVLEVARRAAEEGQVEIEGEGLHQLITLVAKPQSQPGGG